MQRFTRPKPKDESRPAGPRSSTAASSFDRTVAAFAVGFRSKMTAETPASVLDLLELPGVGPKTAALLHQKFKIASLDDLRTFAEGGGLEMVDGIGTRTAERIKASLARR